MREEELIKTLEDLGFNRQVLQIPEHVIPKIEGEDEFPSERTFWEYDPHLGVEEFQLDVVIDPLSITRSVKRVSHVQYVRDGWSLIRYNGLFDLGFKGGGLRQSPLSGIGNNASLAGLRRSKVGHERLTELSELLDGELKSLEVGEPIKLTETSLLAYAIRISYMETDKAQIRGILQNALAIPCKINEVIHRKNQSRADYIAESDEALRKYSNQLRTLRKIHDLKDGGL